MAAEYDYEQFKKEVLKLTDIDLGCYKEKQMKRRIDTMIANHRIDGYASYAAGIKTDRSLYDEFVSFITINVSEFFRNPEQWRFLEREVFPDLIDRFGKKLKIWSAACSTGDEPYSLVMLLSRFLPLSSIEVYATDLDKQILAKAKVGLYKEKSITSVPQDLREKYFVRTGPSYKISDEIKSRVHFQQHNLLTDTYPTDCHLIVCRNVLIYFTEEAKKQVFEGFYQSLKTEGMLFIGSTEQIMNYREIGYVRRNSFFYQKGEN